MTLDDIRAFIAAYPPFDALDAEDLDWLLPRLTRRPVTAGEVLAGPAVGAATCMVVVLQASVRVVEQGGGAADEGSVLSAGECFPIGALIGRRAPGKTYIAAEAGEVLCLPIDEFHALLERSAVFARFCNHYLSSLVRQSQLQLQAHFSRRMGEQQSLETELRSLIKRTPVTAPTDAPLRSVLETMGRERIGSVLIVDADGAPAGIFTQSDVLRRVVLGGAAQDGPIVDAMTPAPATIAESASAYDAMLLMASRAIRHLVLVDGLGRATGVISERDLFALQRLSMSALRSAIEAAADTDALRRALGDVRQCAFNMVAQGVGAEQLTRFISAQNDAVTERVLELNLARHDLTGIEWTWLAFGSEGREEQTLSTDQDNGIVFLAGAGAPETLRQRLLAFARDVNNDLDRCGFPLCKGNIMAGNPEWCLTLDEWKAKFSRWIRTPEPKALLNATIFFDLRALHGPVELAEAMYAHLFAESRGNSAFQRMLASNALEVAPPLGVFRDFSVETDERGKAFIDLKKSGARLFVDVARVHALTHGVAAAATQERLRRTAGEKGGLGDDVDAVIDAFNFIQMLRLRHQHLEAGRGRAGDNRIFIGDLNDLERRILKESFRQARTLQQGLKLNYQL